MWRYWFEINSIDAHGNSCCTRDCVVSDDSDKAREILRRDFKEKCGERHGKLKHKNIKIKFLEYEPFRR